MLFCFSLSLISMITYNINLKFLQKNKYILLYGSTNSAFIFTLIVLFLYNQSHISARNDFGWYVLAGSLTTQGYYYMTFYFFVEMANHLLSTTIVIFTSKNTR